MQSPFPASLQPPVLTLNRHGISPFVIICDHASNRIPEEYGTLGLTPEQRLMHIAWDPGALGVSKRLSIIFDAPLVHATVSRLIVDPNRAPGSPRLIPEVSELTSIPGNAALDESERADRIARYHLPFHQAIDALLDERAARGLPSVLVCMHSFTPVYEGVERPWPVGIIPGRDEAFSLALFDALQADGDGLNIGWNQPYAAETEVVYTFETHGDRRGLIGSMIEIRNTEILDPPGVALWSDRMSRCLQDALMASAPDAASRLPATPSTTESGA